MMTIHRILFSTDYSACAESAFTHAAHLADRYGAQLHVLHVRAPDGGYLDECFNDFRISPDDIAADLNLPIFERDGRASDEPVALVETEEPGPDPAPVILRYAEDHDIDLVVMGTHGRRGLRRLVIGSVAEEVVRLAPCPVFTVRRPDGAAPPSVWSINRVLAPVDLSARSRLAARHAAALAAAYDADLDLVFVIEAPTPTVTLPMSTVGTNPEAAQSEADKVLGGFAETLQSEVRSLRGRVTSTVRIGHPVRDTLDVADSLGTDLIVLGSHGRTGFRRFLLGSVAEQLIRLAPCPVFTLKSFGKSLVPSPADRSSELAHGGVSV